MGNVQPGANHHGRFLGGGVNTLDLVVHNDGLNTGVLLQGEFTCAPEPATVAFLASGLGLIALGRWRR
jgi:hypothetical protein